MKTISEDFDDLQRYGTALRALARSLLCDEGRAEDVVQDAYVAALEKGTGLIALPRAWLARVVRNRSIKVLRSEANVTARERLVAKEEAALSSDEVLERIELQEVVLNAVRELREPYRSCLWLRFFEDLPPAQIARRLDVPLKTVKSRLSRGRAELRRSLENRVEGDWMAALGAWVGWRDSLARGSTQVGSWLAGVWTWKVAATAALGLTALITLRAVQAPDPAKSRARAGEPAIGIPLHRGAGDARDEPAALAAPARAGRSNVFELAGSGAQDVQEASGTPQDDPPAASAALPELVPAGTINAALVGPDPLIIVDDHPGARAHASAVRDGFLKGAKILTGREALEADLSGHTLVVYATPHNPWLARHSERLPFHYTDDGLTLTRTFKGDHLRCIAAVRSPEDAEQRAVLYTAADPADLVNINSVYHGPTEWLVADGGRTLATGSWVVESVLSAERARADLEFLRARILAVHPSTHDGVPEELGHALESASESLDGEVSREELWFVLNRVILALHDAHSSLAFLDSGESLDLPLRWLQDGLYVDADTDRLRRGDRVLSIAGKSEAEWLEVLRDLIPAETDVWVRLNAPRVLRDAGVLRLLGLDDEPPVEVVVELEAEEVEVSVPLGTTPSSARSTRPWVGWTIEAEHDLGLFVLDSCRPDELYLSTVDEFFVAVAGAGVSKIAIDLRENSGGNSRVVNEFMRYLDVPSFRDYSADVRVSEESIAQRGGYGLEPGLHRHPEQVAINDRHDDPMPFDGELFVLTSPRTFSSGNWFAVVLKDNRLATVVGEPTGNSPSSYGDILRFSLPESGFSFTLSHKRFRRPDSAADPADSLEPDVLVPLESRHLLGGRDPVLEHLRQR